MKPIVRSLFAAAASALCLNFGGCAVAISKDGIYLAAGNNAMVFGGQAQRHNTPATPTPVPSERELYERTRNQDPLYQEGLRAMRSIANYQMPKDYDYDQLKKDVTALVTIIKVSSYFVDALITSGLMESFDPEQAVEDQFKGAAGQFVALFLEREMATTLIALAGISDSDTARNLCKKDQNLVTNLHIDLGVYAADLLDKRIPQSLRNDYIGTCGSHMGRDMPLVHTPT